MLSLSPLFSNPNGCLPLDQSYFQGDIEFGNSPAFLDFPPENNTWQQAEIGFPTAPKRAAPQVSDDLIMAVKKLNHNASERDRRKKVNNMYSSLRALLPSSDHTKKLSIPATVSRALKYIPELQRQVEELLQKREELSSRIDSKQRGIFQVKQEINNQTKITSPAKLSCVSSSQLNGEEVSIQISTYKSDNKLLSETLRDLEEDGLSVLNASSFESSGGRVFHNLHLKVEGPCRVQYRTLRDMLVSLCDNEELLL